MTLKDRAKDFAWAEKQRKGQSFIQGDAVFDAAERAYLAGAKWQRRADKLTLAQLAVVRAAKAWASPEGRTVQGRVQTEPALYSALTFLEHMETEGRK